MPLQGIQYACTRYTICIYKVYNMPLKGIQYDMPLQGVHTMPLQGIQYAFTR